MKETNKHILKAMRINKNINTVCLEPREFLDSAISGVRVRHGVAHLVYSYNRLVRAFMAQHMSEEEAREWIDYNTARAIPYMRGPRQAEPVLSEPK